MIKLMHMIYSATVTSQGQITIPAQIRKKLFNKTKSANITVEKNRVIIEPVPDLLSLSGSLHKYALKGKTIDEIMRLEEEAAAQAVTDSYRKKMKRMGIPIPKVK